MSELESLLAFVFDDTPSPLSAEFETWVRGSRRFKAFALAHQTKIRTKLRNVRDEGGLLDVRAELYAAVLLLRDERFTLEYEKYAASRQRAPDFTVTFKTHTPFNVEVRRIRPLEWDDDSDARLIKLMAILSDKVGQMPPGIVNLLWLTTARAVTLDDLTRAAGELLKRANAKNEDFFTRRGFESAAAFVRQVQHLSAIVLHQADSIEIWLNTQARHKPPPDIVSAIQRLI